MQHIAVPDADNSWSVLNLTDNTVTASAGGHAEGGDGLLWNGTTPAAAAPQSQPPHPCQTVVAVVSTTA